MLGSTILDQIVTPALFFALGRRVVDGSQQDDSEAEARRIAERLFPDPPAT
jgi:hypothetical protein